MKNIFLILFAILASLTSIKAQPGSPDPAFGNNGFSLFQPGYGTMPHDSGDDIVAAADGTSYICGAAKVGTTYQGILLNVLPNGTLNNTFGNAGKVMLNYGDFSETYAKNIDMLPDGKLVVSGITILPGNDPEFFVARFLPDGTPDVTFGAAGHFVTALSSISEESCYAQAIQADGKIVLAGATGILPGYNSILVRVNGNGTLDNTFGTGGYTMITNWANHDKFNSVSALPTGEIVAIGTATNELFEERAFIAKFNSAGSLVSAFGDNGVLVPAFLEQNSGCNGLALFSNFLYLTGWIGGEDTKNIYACKLDLSGNPATDFGIGGIAVTDVTVAPSGAEAGLDIKIQPDGKVVVCGTTGLPGPADRNLIVLRYTATGILDPGFGNTSSGYTITSLGNQWDEFNGLDFLPNGKIVATGMSPQNSDNAIVAACYLNNGFEPGASFTVNNDSICNGSTVQYTSTSVGYFLQYNWSFPGGTPSSSTLQNPTVQYNTTGVFNAQLTVTNVIGTDTELISNLITVHNSIPAAPAVPAGSTALCSGQSATYSILPVPGAISYLWSITPAAAGTLIPNGTSATFNSSSIFTGGYTISVIATGQCGNSPSSPALSGAIATPPQIFMFEGEGSYCSGTSGAVLSLSGSQSGTNYELLLNGALTGNILAGTGSALTWNNLTQQGFYTVNANNTSCSMVMAGQIYVSMISAPAQPSAPTGDTQVCNGETSIYNIVSVANATSYQWTLNPANAGIISSNGVQVTVIWDTAYSGSAELWANAANICGLSSPAPSLIIIVSESPKPIISGIESACQNWTADYETAYTAGNTYLWTVTGGNIESGVGTAAVNVKWTSIGTGTITVIESTPQNCSGTSLSLAVLVDPCVGVENQALTQNLTVYPNPATGILSVNFPECTGKTSELNFIDPTGRIVLKYSFDNSMNDIEKLDVTTLKKGYYLLQYIVDRVVVSQTKIIKN